MLKKLPSEYLLSTMTQTAWLLVIIPDSMIIMLTFISIYQVNQTPASHRTLICLAFDSAIPGTHQVCLFIGNRSLSYQCSQKHLSTLPLYIIPSLTIYLYICLEPQESRSWVNPYSSHYCTIYGTLSLLTHANIFSWFLWQFIHFPPIDPLPLPSPIYAHNLIFDVCHLFAYFLTKYVFSWVPLFLINLNAIVL